MNSRALGAAGDPSKVAAQLAVALDSTGDDVVLAHPTTPTRPNICSVVADCQTFSDGRANGANLAGCIHRFSRLGAQYFNAYRAPTSADYGHGA